jgi:dUTPase
MWDLNEDDGDILKVKKIVHNAKIPEKPTYILTYPYLKSIVISPNSCVTIPIGITIELPFNCRGKIETNFAFAYKTSIVVDGEITNKEEEVRIRIFNHSTKSPFIVKTGDCVAKLLIQPIKLPLVKEK